MNDVDWGPEKNNILVSIRAAFTQLNDENPEIDLYSSLTTSRTTQVTNYPDHIKCSFSSYLYCREIQF